MITFDEARERILDGVEPLGSERLALLPAAGRVLAERLVAPAPMPPFDYSAMDGYALDAASLSGSGPWTLPVRGESRTGGVPPVLELGAACRIFTGAELPATATTVLMQEDVERTGDTIVFSKRPPAGAHVRRRGEDLAAGSVALEPGTRLGPAQIGLVASLDRAHVLVARRPRVAILCTGDELRSPGDPPRPGSIPESNGSALGAMVLLAGGDPALLPYARDDAKTTLAAVKDAIGTSDLLLTVGGVSVGDHDLVRPALEAAGAKLDFWKVKIKPGKPLASGKAGRTRVLGLPGNPVSAMVTFALFGAPLVRKLQGDRQPVPAWRRAVLTQAVRQEPGRRAFLRAVLDGQKVTPIDNQASGSVTSLAWANSLMVVHEDAEGLPAGAEVDVLLLADV